MAISTGVGDIELEVCFLSDGELAAKLRQLGANIGPVTDSTRGVYQRKLQRWLKYGPGTNGPSTASSQSAIEVVSHTDLKTANCVQNHEPLTNGVSAEAATNGSALLMNHTAVTDIVGNSSSVLQPAKDETVEVAHRPEMDKKTRSRRRDTKIVPAPPSVPSSNEAVERGDEATEVRFSQRSIKEKTTSKVEKKAVASTEDLPTVSLEDIELVDRVLAAESSVPYSSSSSTSSFSRHSFSKVEDSTVRSRHPEPLVTPRPALHNYREDVGRGITPERLSEYRAYLLEGHLSAVSASPLSSSSQLGSAATNSAAVPVSRSLWLGSPWVGVIIVVSLIAIIIAVFYNMEPGFTNPV